MKYSILPFLFFVIAACTAIGQTNRTYAITGTNNNLTYWADIKQVDLTTGKVLKTIYQANSTAFKSFSNDEQILLNKANTMAPGATGLGVAACAIDLANNRLYFAPLHFSSISYLDLNKEDVNFTTIKTNLIKQTDGGIYSTEENQFTRMTFGADGYGYALSNDANHLIRFSTGKNNLVEDLGALLDDDKNSQISIHNKCSGWGGGMVADAFGKLVVISSMHQIFNIDVKSKIATYFGNITGLPDNYTTNAAVVDADGWLIVGCANILAPLYKVNLKEKLAIKIDGADKYFNTSDMANGNLLSQKEFTAANKFLMDKKDDAVKFDNEAKIFPNPIIGSNFNLKLVNQQTGNYKIIVTDITGKILQSNTVSIFKSNQIVSITLLRKPTSGTYFIKALNDKNKTTLKDIVIIN